MPQEHLLVLTYATLTNEKDEDIYSWRTYFCQGFATTFHRIWSLIVLKDFQPIPMLHISHPIDLKRVNKTHGITDILTNAVSSCGLEISLATIVDDFVCLTDGVGVLSLSFSPFLEGVGLTFSGNASDGICSRTRN
jgi:hypothetical protein